MPRRRSLVAIAVMTAGVAILLAAWLGGPPRIHVRWTADTTDQIRTTAEQTLRLTRARFEGGRTWSYDLRDASGEHLDQIFRHPAFEDWAGIGRDRTLKPDAPPLQAWLQVRYEVWPVSWIAASGLFVGPALCVLGIVLVWPAISRLAAGADWRIAAVIVLATILRVWLIVQGGQYYWPDERQYREAKQVVAAALAADPDWMQALLAAPAAVVLKLFAVLPALIEDATGENPHVPALFFGLCSVISIWLIAAIARRLEADRDTTFLAALLAGGSTTLFYMSRHILNYDLALMLGLFSVFAGVNRSGGWKTSFRAAAWAVAAFFAYAGVWMLAGAACAIHVTDTRTVRDAARRAMLVLAGAAAVVAIFATVYRLAGLSWWQQMVAFAGTVRQGEFDEGWRLPLDYLWHAEHVLFIAWLIALAFCVARVRWSAQTRLTRAGIVGVVCIYAALAISSTVLHQFVVYGRLSRPLVPFFCLLTAGVIGTMVIRVPRGRVPALAAVTVAVVAQALINFRIPLQQQFPAQFIAAVERRYPEPRLFVNAKHLYPGPERVTVPPGYREVATAAHPLQFLPYQYEGFAEGERRGLRLSDLRMRAWIGPQENRR